MLANEVDLDRAPSFVCNQLKALPADLASHGERNQSRSLAAKVGLCPVVRGHQQFLPRQRWMAL